MQATTKSNRERTGIYAAVAAAVAASICCLGPLVLVGLGASGAWIGNLSAMEPFRPYLIAASAAALGYAFWRVYRAPAAECGPDGECKINKAPKYNKIALWVATIGIAAMLAAPGLLGAAAANDGTAEAPVAVARSLADTPAAAAPVKEASVMLVVDNMTCTGCSATVHKALTRVDGVLGAKVTHDPPCANVWYDANKTGPDNFTAATTAVGYPSKVAAQGGDKSNKTAVCLAKAARKG